MKTDALSALREQIKNDSGLKSYLKDRFGREGRHIIGLKRGKKADEFPYFCYVLGHEERENFSKERLQDISILWGINEKRIEKATDTFLGVLETAEIGELLISAIFKDCTLGNERIRVEPDIETATDLGMRHPIYEAEMALKVRIRE